MCWKNEKRRGGWGVRKGKREMMTEGLVCRMKESNYLCSVFLIVYQKLIISEAR